LPPYDASAKDGLVWNVLGLKDREALRATGENPDKSTGDVAEWLKAAVC
jgi:hypothetical protein